MSTPDEIKKAKHATYMREYRKKNKERDAEKNRLYHQNYRAENRDHINELAKLSKRLRTSVALQVTFI